MQIGIRPLGWRKFLVASCVTLLAAASAQGESLRLRFDASNAQAAYAAERLKAVIKQRKLDQRDFDISLAVKPDSLKPESFAVSPGKGSIAISGGDGRGLIYGALSVVEQLRNGAALSAVRQEQSEPALAFRAIKFNLPWESYRSSSSLDQHYQTVRDPKYWERFLDMMVENRYNALTLWNLHPFPYMIRAKNFPEASRFTDAELAEWKKFYQTVFNMAKVRGIDTYLVNWNILVSEAFAKSHGLKETNFYPYYKGKPNTSELVKRYNRESVAQVLQEYPELTGFGFTFAEQMEGMTPKERQDWMDEVIVAGMRDAKRPVKMIFRAPLSAGLDQEGSTSKATEQLARDSIEKLGNTFDGPVWVELKFNWSHAHSATELVKVHGGKLKDTFFTPTPQNFKVTWMARNEDFYALRWGVPGFIRDHIAKNGHQDYVGGYFVGSENYIPAKDYFTALNAPVDWKYAFERQWLFYELWGRLLYDPATPDSVFEADFVRRYGTAAKPLLSAYAKASATQLRYATSVDFGFDFTIYGEGMMVLNKDGIRIEPMAVDRLIEQKPLLANWLSVKDFVAKRATGEAIPEGTMTPLKLADELEADNREALRLVENIDVSKNASLRYEVADVKVWANLGLYYAAKLRGAVAVQTYRTLGGEQVRQESVTQLDQSLRYWDEVVAITQPLYKIMPLTHYNGPNNARKEDNAFHWSLLRPDIAKDIEAVKKSLDRK